LNLSTAEKVLALLVLLVLLPGDADADADADGGDGWCLRTGDTDTTGVPTGASVAASSENEKLNSFLNAVCKIPAANNMPCNGRLRETPSASHATRQTPIISTTAIHIRNTRLRLNVLPLQTGWR
jgi:hypothetical protein